MATFAEFLTTLKAEIVTLASGSFNDARQAATKDAQAFLTQTKADLEKWTGLLAAGTITHEEFEFLVMGRKEVATMEALKEAGLTAVRIERFQGVLLHTIIESAFKAFA